MIEIRNVNKSFKTKKVLNHISLNLNNQTYALLGPNGSFWKNNFIKNNNEYYSR